MALNEGLSHPVRALGSLRRSGAGVTVARRRGRSLSGESSGVLRWTAWVSDLPEVSPVRAIIDP